MNPTYGTFAEMLAAQVRSRGHAPLLTYYDVGSGERTELGYATFANWVAKTANFLVESDVARGDDVLVAADGHWAGFVAAAACGVVGARAMLSSGPPAEATNAALAVVHEDHAHAAIAAPRLVVGSGLGGMPMRGVTGDDLIFVEEVRACPDEYVDETGDADADWLLLPDDTVQTARDLATSPAAADRVLLTEPLEAAMSTALSAVASGGSVVALRGADLTALRRVFADERCTRSAPGILD